MPSCLRPSVLPASGTDPSFWDRPPLGSAGHRLSLSRSTPECRDFRLSWMPHPNLGSRASSPCSWSPSPWEGPWGVIVQRMKLRPCEGFQEVWVVRIRRQPPGIVSAPSLLWPWTVDMEEAHPGWGPREPLLSPRCTWPWSPPRSGSWTAGEVAERPSSKGVQQPACCGRHAGQVGQSREPRSSSASVVKPSWGWWASYPL